MLDENRLQYFLRRESAIGDRIARESARVRRYVVAKPPLAPSTGPSLGHQMLEALRRPGPINVGRPANGVGASSFHFKITSHAKDSSFDGFARRPLSASSVAGAHQSYLERIGADTALNQQYLERGDPGLGPVVASFGNIGRSFRERLDFWNAVTDAAHAPASFAVATLYLDRDPEFWKEVRADEAAPEALRSVLASNSRKLILKDVVSTALLMTYLRTFPATDKLPVVISPGRGGRTQTRIVAELPHEVSDQTRRSIAEAFCDKMFGKKPGIRFWAVIHAPDEHNDAKNYHLHVVFHDRPTRKVPDQTGKRVWDFEVCELRYDKKNRNRRLRRPKRQNRDREFSRRDWPATARKQYAEIVNRALKDAGLTPRFDPRKYTEMGIDLETIPRASARAYSAEKRGVVTEAARGTIEAQWARYQSLLARQYDALTLPSDIQRRFEDAAIAAVQQHLLESITRQIASDYEAWKSALRLKHSALAENAALELNVRRMTSRVVPIIGAPQAKTPQMDYLAALSDELRAPIDRSYRQATIQERRALEALARHEAEIALGHKLLQPPANITRPLSRDERPNHFTRLPATTRRRNALQQQVDEDPTLADELAADAAEALALQCACASAPLDLTLIADANPQKPIAQAADQAIDTEPEPRAVDRDAPAPDVVMTTAVPDYADRANSVALLRADRALTLTDQLAADAAEALALQCACVSASLALALTADANRQRRTAQPADQAVDEEVAHGAVDRDAPAPGIAAKTTPLDYADRADIIALSEADRALTITDEIAADAADALALRCACASASLDLALTANANRTERIAQAADQAIAAAPDIAAITTAPECASRGNNVAQLEAEHTLTLTDELAADAAEALALQCACATTSLDLALIGDANRQKRIAQVADQTIDEEPAETIRGERAQSAAQIESTPVGATIPLVLTPHKEKPDDGRNQPDAAERFRRQESGIADNDRSIADTGRDDAQDAFVLPAGAGALAKTTEGFSIDATTRRDMGVTPGDLVGPPSSFEPDCGRGDGYGDKGKYRDLRDMPTIGSSRRTVSARPHEQITHEEAHLGLQNGSEIPTGFGNHRLQPPSASAGRPDGSYGSADQPSATSDELRDEELTRIRQRRDKLRSSVDVSLRFSSIAAKIVGRYNQRYFLSALSALRRNTSANASDILGYLTSLDERSPGRRRWIGAWMRELSDFRIQDKVRPEPPSICVSMNPIIARRRRKAGPAPSGRTSPSSSVKPKDETPGTIPVTARRRSTRPPPDQEAPPVAVPAHPMTHPTTGSRADPRTDTTMGSTTSAATTRNPTETLADAKAIPAPENRPTGSAQTAVDRVATVVAATVEATTTTGSSAAAEPDGKKPALPKEEGPIIPIAGRPYQVLQRKPPGRER
jgi:hypothetical protein